MIINKISIIVPAYNEEFTVAKTIKSLLKLDYPKDKLEYFARRIYELRKNYPDNTAG
mgnify:CR=1 FL=1